MAYVVIILRCMFKLLILDVDGVLTTGCKTYDLEGNVISKEFNDKDFTAIKRFKEKGLKVCFLTADDRVNRIVAKNRNIDFYYVREMTKKNKVETLPYLTSKYKVTLDEIAYIGDDINDLEVLQAVGLSCMPSSSPILHRTTPDIITQRKGGEGAFREFADFILCAQDITPIY